MNWDHYQGTFGAPAKMSSKQTSLAGSPWLPNLAAKMASPKYVLWLMVRNLFKIGRFSQISPRSSDANTWKDDSVCLDKPNSHS